MYFYETNKLFIRLLRRIVHIHIIRIKSQFFNIYHVSIYYRCLQNHRISSDY